MDQPSLYGGDRPGPLPPAPMSTNLSEEEDLEGGLGGTFEHLEPLTFGEGVDSPPDGRPARPPVLGSLSAADPQTSSGSTQWTPCPLARWGEGRGKDEPTDPQGPRPAAVNAAADLHGGEVAPPEGGRILPAERRRIDPVALSTHPWPYLQRGVGVASSDQPRPRPTTPVRE